MKLRNKVRTQSDSPGFLKVSEISDELEMFSDIICEKYKEIKFDFAFCFRAVQSLSEIRTIIRFYKKENWLGIDLWITADEFIPYKKNIVMQRKIIGKYFFPLFSETIIKYKKKLPSLKLIAEDLIEDMRLFLIDNLWLEDDNGFLKLSIIENVSFSRVMSLLGNPKHKKFDKNENDEKIQYLTWEIDEQKILLASFVLRDRNWLLLNYDVQNI